MDIAPASIPIIVKIVKIRNYQIFSASIEDISTYLDRPEISKAEEEINLRQCIPVKYHEFLSVFSSKEAERLHPHRYIDHEILIDERKKLTLRPGKT